MNDIKTLLRRVGQEALEYREFSVPSDLEVAQRFPLFGVLLAAREAPNRAAAPGPVEEARS